MVFDGVFHSIECKMSTCDMKKQETTFHCNLPQISIENQDRTRTLLLHSENESNVIQQTNCFKKRKVSVSCCADGAYVIR